MNNINKTLYIPLYGKAYVSKRGIILNDKKAEEIWEKEKFPLKSKSKSKWLSFYMGMRSAVFDEKVKEYLNSDNKAIILHIGCGMDSRALRINTENKWYDIDFPEVINERKRYYRETSSYKMIGSDVKDKAFLNTINEKDSAIIVMEGVSMYLSEAEFKNLISNLSKHFNKFTLLIDFYSSLAAKLSKYKNPINDVGVREVYGIDGPEIFITDNFKFIKEHDMTPDSFINELKGSEKFIFKKLYAGKFSKNLYKLYEYRKY